MRGSCPFVLASLLALALAASTGCAAPAEEEGDDATAAAQTRNPAYDEAVRAATAKVTADDTPNAQRSSETTLIGYIPNAKADKILAKLLDVARWTEIKDGDAAPFTSATATSDDEGSPKRIVRGKVVLQGDVSLDVRLTADDAGENGYTVAITNTTGYRHWLLGTVLEPGKLTMTIKLVPYERGLVVDARATVKLLKAEDRAPRITGAVRPIFAWLKGG